MALAGSMSRELAWGGGLIAAAVIADCLCTGGALTGASVVVGKALTIAAGGVGGNMLHKLFGDHLADYAKRSKDPRDQTRNHDLRDLTGRTIATCIAIAEREYSGPSDGKAFLKKLVGVLPEGWATHAHEHAYRGISEEHILRYFKGQSRDRTLPAALRPDLWEQLLGRIADDADVPVHADALSFTAGILHDRFARVLLELTKADFAPGETGSPHSGKAFAAYLLGMLRDITGDLSYLVKSADIAAIRQEETLKAVRDVQAAVNARFNAVSRLAPEDIDSIVGPITTQFDALSNELAGHIGTILTRLSELNDKSDKILALLHSQGVSIMLDNKAPAPPDRFVPRPALMNELIRKLQGSGTASVTGQVAAQGDGGQGKSVLALAYARDYAEYYDNRCYRVVVENKSLEDAMASMLPDWPEFKDFSQNQRARLVRAVLSAGPRSLLIIDNVVSVQQWADPMFRSLLPACPCDVILTTRERELPGAPSVHVGKLEDGEAIELLASFQGSAAEPGKKKDVLRVVRAVEGLAVAVAAVGAMMRISEDDDWGAYAARLEELPIAQLPEGDADVQPYLHGYSVRIAAALDDLYAKLPVPERRAMDYAAYLPQDLIPGVDHARPEAAGAMFDWLVWLIEQDAASPDPSARLDLGQKKSGAPRTAVDVVKKLQSLSLLTPANPERTLWSMHRLHARRCTERVRGQAGSALTSVSQEPALLDRLIELGEARGMASHNAVAGNQEITDEAARVRDRDGLRAELSPLMALAGVLDDADRAQAGLSVANWVHTPLHDLGRFADGRENLFRFLRPDRDWAGGGETEGHATGYSNLATIQQNQGDLPGARASIERAIKIDARNPNTTPRKRAIRFSILGIILKVMGLLTQARKSMDSAIAIGESSLKADDPALAVWYSNLAMIQQDQGDLYQSQGEFAKAKSELAAARASMERAIAIAKKNLGPDHPDLAIMRSNLAMIQQDQGDLPGARASMERAIAIDQKHFAPDHPNFGIRFTNLAGICYAEGDRAAACANLKKALGIFLKHFDENHPHVKSVRRNMKNAGCGGE